MTFSLYLQNLGFTILNNIPTAIIFYVAVRLAFTHGPLEFKHSPATKKKD